MSILQLPGPIAPVQPVTPVGPVLPVLPVGPKGPIEKNVGVPISVFAGRVLPKVSPTEYTNESVVFKLLGELHVPNGTLVVPITVPSIK